MKILVTGGCGFIGSHIVDAYIEAGHEVVVADKKKSNLFAYKNNQANYYQIDLTDSKKVNSLFEKIKPDIINHHAANISLAKSIEKPLYDAKNNITAVINILESAEKHGTKKIIFASSAGALYSGNTSLPFTEKTSTNPISPYGVSKLASEYYIKVYAELYALEYVILRYSNIYGPRQNNTLKPIVSVFIEDLKNDQQPIINNDGSQTRDFLFVEDLKSANLLALTYKKNACFNISSESETTIAKLFTKIKQMLKSNIEPKFKSKKIKEQQRSFISNAKAREKLGWNPKYNLKQGLSKTIEWYRDGEKENK